MNIKLYRTATTSWGTEGFLMIGNKKICDTVENSMYKLMPGKYEVFVYGCRQYQNLVPIILHGMNHGIGSDCCKTCILHKLHSLNASLPLYCPQFKAGHGVLNRNDGSILVGEYLTDGTLINTKHHFRVLTNMLKKAQDAGEKITLTICQPVY